MKIEIINGPTRAFLEMLTNSIGPMHRDTIQTTQWGAVALVQAMLVELYFSADLAEKASDVKTVLVSGSCPQHIQMLAILGNPAAVNTAIDKIKNYYMR